MNIPFILKPTLVVLLVVGGPVQGTTQTPEPPTVPDLLQHLDSIIDQYDTALPDVFCDETLHSTHTHDGRVTQDVREQSVLRAYP